MHKFSCDQIQLTRYEEGMPDRDRLQEGVGWTLLLRYPRHGGPGTPGTPQLGVTWTLAEIVASVTVVDVRQAALAGGLYTIS